MTHERVTNRGGNIVWELCRRFGSVTYDDMLEKLLRDLWV